MKIFRCSFFFNILFIYIKAKFFKWSENTDTPPHLSILNQFIFLIQKGNVNLIYLQSLFSLVYFSGPFTWVLASSPEFALLATTAVLTGEDGCFVSVKLRSLRNISLLFSKPLVSRGVCSWIFHSTIEDIGDWDLNASPY